MRTVINLREERLSRLPSDKAVMRLYLYENVLVLTAAMTAATTVAMRLAVGTALRQAVVDLRDL